MPTNSTETLSAGKRLVFYLVLLSPLLALVGGGLYLLLGTSLVQDVYLASWRNLETPCMRWTDEGYGYKAKPGPCVLNNLEYQTVMTFDEEGFRNADTRAPSDVVLIGDSHTQGFGVKDAESFPEVLRSRYHLRTKNLGISSYATLRELESLKAYSGGAKVVVLQYCNNDADENKRAVESTREEFLRQVHSRWLHMQARYHDNKARGPIAPVLDLAHAIYKGDYKSRARFEARSLARNMPWEADNFAKIVARYRPVLEGKKLIVFESSGYGFNHPGFKSTFEAALSQHAPGLDVVVLDSQALLKRSDYYRIDDHLNPQGHEHLAQILSPLITDGLKSPAP